MSKPKEISILPLGLKEVTTHNTGPEMGILFSIGGGHAVWTPKTQREGMLYESDDKYEALIADLPDDEYTSLIEAITHDVDHYMRMVADTFAKVTAKTCGNFMVGGSQID